MEFNEKLVSLRKQKGLTQEELARALYVSRTAVSKWESGRGYPGLDSLKQIAAYFSVSVDELLSGGEILAAAEEEKRQHTQKWRDTVYALCDFSHLIFLFFPLFALRESGQITEVSLTFLSSPPLLQGIGIALTVFLTLVGIATLTLPSFWRPSWVKCKVWLSIVPEIIGIIAFSLCLQPYAAVFMFFLFLMKTAVLFRP